MQKGKFYLGFLVDEWNGWQDMDWKWMNGQMVSDGWTDVRFERIT